MVISFAIIGGILLNIGAFLTFRGKIYQAVVVYIAADICWVVLAYQHNDWWGVLLIAIGTMFGFLAFVKMQQGVMHKTLTKD